MDPRVAIILLNFNRPEDTIECIASLKKISYSNAKIFVVDNYSNDDSIHMISTAYPEIEILALNQNLGFAEGNNLGIMKSLKDKPDYLLLLNNDTTVDSDFLSILIKEAESNSNAEMFGPLILYSNNSENIWWGGGTLSYMWPRHKYQGQKLSKLALINSYQDFLTGCCILLRKSLIDTIGLLDPSFFLYYEDVDWCLRAKKAGRKLLFVPKSIVYHKVSASVGGAYSVINRYYSTRNRFLLISKHASILEKIFFYLFVLPVLVVRNVLILWRKPAFLKAFFAGLKDGYTGKFGKNI